MLLYTLLIAAFMAITFANGADILDYSKLPSCARNCDILRSIEHDCFQQNANNPADALVCVCNSPQLHLLHIDGFLCLAACNAEESDSIHLEYNVLCEWEEPTITNIEPTITNISPPTSTTLESSSASTPSSANTSPPTTLSTVPNGPTLTIDPPSPSPSTTNADTKAEDHKTWVTTHTKFLVITGVLIGAALVALLIAAFILHHRHRKAELERAFQQNGLIPLQALSPRQTPLPPTPRASEENLPATAIITIGDILLFALFWGDHEGL